MEARSGSLTDHVGKVCKLCSRRATKEAWALAPQAFRLFGMRAQLFCCYLDYLHSLLSSNWCRASLFWAVPTRKSNYTQPRVLCQGGLARLSANFAQFPDSDSPSLRMAYLEIAISAAVSASASSSSGGWGQ